MNRLPFILSFILLLYLSCTPEESGVQDSKDNFTACFAASFPEENVLWQVGDEISVNGHIYVTAQGGKDASFTPDSDPAPSLAEYLAVFPAGLEVDGMTVSGFFPQEHKVSQEEYVDREFLVSVAKSGSKSLTFQSLLSFVSVTVLVDGVSGVTFSSNGSESVCGNFKADVSGKMPVVYVEDGKSSVTVSDETGKSFAKGTKLCFAVLPRTLKNGFTFKTSFDAEHGGESWTVSIPDHTVLYRGQLLDLGDFYYNYETGTGRLNASSDVNVALDLSNAAPDPVSRLLFGSFSEMHGGDLIPGICEQYVVNTSFEPWQSAGFRGESKNELVFTGNDAVPEDADVAYPWEKRQISGVSSFAVTTAERRNTSSSQMICIESGASAVLLQRLALPYYRVKSYDVKFHAKVVGDVTIKASFHDTGSLENTVVSDVYSPVMTSGDWKEYGHTFVLSSSGRLFNNRHNQYNLWLEFSGSGTVYIDHVTLFPTDCVDGMFNPETVAYFKEYKVSAIRWPGGNYTSGYDWRNGTGPWIDRPCTMNNAWGGLDSNFLGTDEIVRFCELTGVELIMGVGYNTSLLSGQDMIDWVKYCKDRNYRVKYWGIGNEVYGSYQQGHVSASSYSSGLASVAAGMRAVDPEIRILASGSGVHNHYRGNYPGWTETVCTSAASSFDLLDCHMYVYGNDSSNPLNLSGPEYFRIFAAANLNLRDFIGYIREIAPDKKLALLEWGVLPKLSGNSYATPQRQTFANLLISACEFHEMMRNSDVVEMAAMHNFSFYVAPHKLHSEPVNVRTNLIKELSVLSDGHYIPIDEQVFPTYDQDVDFLDIGVRKRVPEIDMLAVRKGDLLYLSCVNRSLSEDYSVALMLQGASLGEVEGSTYTCSRPYTRSLWSDVVYTKAGRVETDGKSKVTLPPMSYSILKITLKDN